MSNQLYKEINQNNQNNNMGNLVERFQRFKQMFQGDPKQKVMEMLQSGQISQQQLNQAQNMAHQFSRFLK